MVHYTRLETLVKILPYPNFTLSEKNETFFWLNKCLFLKVVKNALPKQAQQFG
jgi:hypothetical protein